MINIIHVFTKTIKWIIIILKIGLNYGIIGHIVEKLNNPL